MSGSGWCTLPCTSPRERFRLAVDATEYDVRAADNGDRITHLMSTQQLWQNLQIAEGGGTHLGPPWVFAAVADEIVAVLPPAVLNGKIGFSPWWTQGHGHAGRNRSRWHLVEGHPAQADALVDLLHAHAVASIAIALLAHLYLYRHLAVGHVGPGCAHIEGHAAPTQHGTGEAIGDGLLWVDIAL